MRKTRESFDERFLLKFYIQNNYSSDTVLLINPYAGDEEELGTLIGELKKYEIYLNEDELTCGKYCIVTCPRGIGQAILRSHEKGSFLMTLWENGEPIDENM